MATLTIRNIEDELKIRLRIEAAQHGHSMEEEVRCILRKVLYRESTVSRGLGSRIHRRFAEIGGIDLELPMRKDQARSVEVE